MGREDELAREWIGYAIRRARRAAERSPRLAEEYESAAVYALLRAIRAHDRGQVAGVNVAPLLRLAIDHALINVRRTARRRHLVRAADLATAFDQLVTAPSVDARRFEARDWIEAHWRLLTHNEKVVCRLIYWDGLDIAEIGRRLLLSSPVVRGIHQAALAALRACPACMQHDHRGA